ncbi:hypothetical protein [Clostridium intestinale]|uniref:Uncharacterized protein n=1 Tax=Clostridium intestinale DSM 6191 TaxID=1121320 RepID=A0A1M5U2E4_9CLOT|nr:hypothetical protein [Clostridium intestinale]SHH56813.1 hypothetical protein SAMN02745941_00379 [Clostridium intestinale DSM 6191]
MDKNYNFKYEKLKIHFNYLLAISLILIALIIIASSYWNEAFVGQVSFAGTISSIILSVIAIIITLIGESKSDNTKDKLLNVSDSLVKTAEIISNSSNELKEISSITSKIEKLYEYMDKVIMNVEETNISIKNLAPTTISSKIDDVLLDVSEMYIRIRDGYKSNAIAFKFIVCASYWFILKDYDTDFTIFIDNKIKGIHSSNENAFDTYIGILYSLLVCDQNNIESLKKEVKKDIESFYPEIKNEIDKHFQ